MRPALPALLASPRRPSASLRLLDDLEALVIQLDDTELVGGDIAIHLVEIGYCNARYHDAIDFASVLRSRLRRYVRSPDVAEAAREDFRKRIGWWKMALGRAFELRKWPALVLTDSNGDGSAI
jgi:hypothetical protein